MNESPFLGYIDQGLEINGDIFAKNPLRIDGKVKGKIKSLSDIIIGKTGEVEGEILVNEIIISGKVRGRICAKKGVKIEESARLEADVITPILSIKEGAVLKGSAKVLPREEVSREIEKVWKS